ncbi:GGDEF domain-containing protein [Nocardia stercoris]|nr:GGDEF domain-containing protein [Nocardia stercoris]
MTVIAALNWSAAHHALAVVLIVDMVVGLLWGVYWTVGPWPGERTSLALMALADGLIGASTLVDTWGFFGSLSVLGLIAVGGYLTVFHGPRILIAHAGWSLAVIVPVSGYRMMSEGGGNIAWLSAMMMMGGLTAGLLPTIHFCCWGLRVDAMTDPLTGLLNRRGLDCYVSRWLGPHDHDPVTVLTVDVDRFKAVNDTLGHAEGDRLLTRIAACLRAERPPGAVVARTGGEEFVVAAQVSPAAAAGEADRVRRAIERAVEPVTVSVGVAAAERRSPGWNFATLLHNSDLAMYRAKQAGGNTIWLSDGRSPAGED